MLSRVANSIYWLSRYMERAENVARFIDVNLQMMLDLPSGMNQQWQPLVSISGDDAEFQKHYVEATRENVIEFLALNEENPNSILACLRAARENARAVRDVISSELWEQVNSSYLTVSAAASSLRMMQTPYGFFTQVKKASHLFFGVAEATLLHGEGWHLYRLGRSLERADKTSRLLDVKYFILLPSASDVGTPLDDIQWAAVLRSASALEMYRKRYGHISPENVIEFLVLDREFPRSIHFCVGEATYSLHAISGTPVGTYHNCAEQQLGQLRSELAYTDRKQIMARWLHEFLDALQTKLNSVDQGVFDTFFALRPVGSAAPDRADQ